MSHLEPDIFDHPAYAFFGDSNICRLHYSYHGDVLGNGQELKQLVKQALEQDKKFILVKDTEPNTLWHIDHEAPAENAIFLFDIVHNIISELNFPAHKFILISANLSVHESYKGYCNAKNIQNPVNVYGYKQFSNIEPIGDCSDHIEPRPYYFTTLNRSFRLSKIQYMNSLYSYGFFDHELHNSFISSFDFSDSIDIVKKEHKHLVPYLKSLEDNSTALDTEHDICSFTQQLEKSVLDSYFDIITDYTQHEDLGYELCEHYKKVHPWWKETMVTEKLIRSIIHCKPFIYVSEPGMLKLLREQYGFKTFDGVLFDESYDNIQDYYQRVNCIVEQVKHIVQTYTLEELHNRIHSPEVYDIVKHNQTVYYDQAYKNYGRKLIPIIVK